MEKRETTAKVGLFGIGLAAYWPQFAGLKERLEGYQAQAAARLADLGAEVISAGLVDTAPAAVSAGDMFACAQVDLIICYVGAYATSSQTLPAVQRGKAPALISPVPARERRVEGPENIGGGQNMQRVGFLLKVKQDKIAEYKKHHQAVWPEMLDALRRTGWRNYSLFMREDGLLFGYCEAEKSFQASLEGMSQEEVNARWQAFMAPYFEGLGGQRADEAMVELEEVFHLD